MFRYLALSFVVTMTAACGFDWPADTMVDMTPASTKLSVVNQHTEAEYKSQQHELDQLKADNAELKRLVDAGLSKRVKYDEMKFDYVATKALAELYIEQVTPKSDWVLICTYVRSETTSFDRVYLDGRDKCPDTDGGHDIVRWHITPINYNSAHQPKLSVAEIDTSK